MKKVICYLIFILFPVFAIGQTHPILVSQADLDNLAASSDWTSIKQFCSSNLNTVIGPGYAGWDLHDAIVKYAQAYQILKSTDATTADKYAKKTLGLMKCIAWDHNLGGPYDTYDYSINAQFVGLADGVKTVFTLPFTPLTGASVQVIVSNAKEERHVYKSAKDTMGVWEPILKISNSTGGTSDYDTSNYNLIYRDDTSDPTAFFLINWKGSKHPASNANYYVTRYSKGDVYQASSAYTISGTSLTFKTAPASGKCIFVQMVGSNYEQTGNRMGALNAVQEDGPGYPMRTFNPGLAYGFDLLYNYAGFTSDLKTEFVKVLNSELDWYNQYGYERDGDLGNYFIRGLYASTVNTAYGTDGVNSKSTAMKATAQTYTDRIKNKLEEKLPGGYGPQGQYTNGVAEDVIQMFNLYKTITGTDLLSQMQWTDNLVPAIIHGTKPDRVTFYDGGDWSDLPATPLTAALQAFLTYLPNHANAPYARQLLKDAGETDIPAGTMTDYKTSYPLAYCAKVSGPVYTRSSWAKDAVWASFSAGEIFMDHQHLDEGHFTIQKGADYLLIDAGEYGDYHTEPWHNTMLFDDRGAGDISVYPPGQGDWGQDLTRIIKYENKAEYAYSQADYTTVYASNYGINLNSVKLARRTFVHIRPQMIIIHDNTKTANANVKKIFNCNFPAVPTSSNGIYTVTKGNSKLFFKPVIPSGIVPVLSTVDGKNPNFRNCQITTSGQVNNTFLNVFEAVPSTTSAMTPISYLNTTGNMEGLEIAKQDTTWVTLFAKTDTLINVDVVSYNFTKTGLHKHIIADLNKNYEYEVTVQTGSTKPLDKQKFTSSSQGTLFFSFNASEAGTVSIGKVGAAPVILAIESIENESLGNKRAVYFVNNQINVKWYSQVSTQLNCKIYTINGKLAGEFHQQVNAGPNELVNNQSYLPNGIYLVQVSDNQGTYAYKVIKQ